MSCDLQPWLWPLDWHTLAAHRLTGNEQFMLMSAVKRGEVLHWCFKHPFSKPWIGSRRVALNPITAFLCSCFMTSFSECIHEENNVFIMWIFYQRLGEIKWRCICSTRRVMNVRKNVLLWITLNIYRFEPHSWAEKETFTKHDQTWDLAYSYIAA